MHKTTTKKLYPKTIRTKLLFTRWDYPGFLLLTGLNWAALVYLLWWWCALNWQHPTMTFGVLTFFLLSHIAFQQGNWWLLPCMRRPLPRKTRAGWKVGVATTFVPGVESLEMLEETVGALIALDYPHETWVLDEGDDDQVKALCQKFGAHHFSRKHLPHYHTASGRFQSRSKHGNYNAWLTEIGFARYEIIAAFDPDHVPEPTFLSQVLGYFDNPQVGYVQVAQVYYNQAASFIARGAAEETYAYYSCLQMASYGLGYPIIIGCHNTHRVTALQQVGGFAPHEADDLLLTLYYRVAGWCGVYLPQILARGLTPVDWSSYLTQQRRWARSVLDIKWRIYPKLARDLPFQTRLISLLHGLSYLWEGLLPGFGLLLLAGMLVTGNVPTGFSMRLLLPLALFYGVEVLCEGFRQRFFLDWGQEWGWHWRAGILRLAKWPYMLCAVYDVLRSRPVSYSITPKRRSPARRALVLWPHLLVLLGTGIAWLIGGISGRLSHPFLLLCAAAVVLGILTLLGTALWSFPASYDPTLRKTQPVDTSS